MRSASSSNSTRRTAGACAKSRARSVGRPVGCPTSWPSAAASASAPPSSRAKSPSPPLPASSALATRERLLRRVDAGERVLLEDVPRAQALRAGPASKGRKKTSSAAGAATPPKADQPAAKKSARFTEYVELTRIEQAMYRNMRLSVRQVLATIHKIWDAQGRHRRLPAELRRELEHTRDFIDEFLARDTGA
jgi:hypothetical protein